MAIRNIRQIGDPILNKVSREVYNMTDRIAELIDDMLETMYKTGGVGLAAPQVGILKRIVVIDTTGDDLHVIINPKLVEADGAQTGDGGCLSLPGKRGLGTRPNRAKSVYQDINLEEQTLEGTELLARAIIHELEHLDGHMYTEKVEGDLIDNSRLTGEEEE